MNEATIAVDEQPLEAPTGANGVPVPANLDPATVALFISVGTQVLSFAGQLIGGKTGDALSGLANQLNGIGYKIQEIGRQMDAIFAQVNVAIDAVDQTNLSKIWPVHSEVMSYRKAFPNGIPDKADTSNGNYISANRGSAEAMGYFQAVNRGAFTFIPTLCHVTNTRLEFAVNTWPCWFAQNDATQPNFTGELNLSVGQLDKSLSRARPNIGKEVRIVPIYPSKAPRNVIGGDDPDHPRPEPKEPIGFKVVEKGVVLWQKMGENLDSEARRQQRIWQSKRQNEVLGSFTSTRSHWASSVARMAPAGIARALNLGDAAQFMQYANPRMLVSPDGVTDEMVADGETGMLYQPLPLRNILLDMLTSEAMRGKHSLLTKGADRRSVGFCFDKTFHREPNPNEVDALMQVVNIFGFDSLFGCLAYSEEYADRFGDGMPSEYLPGKAKRSK